MIDVLPVLDFDVSELPAHLQRALYEAFRLKVSYNKLNHRMRCEVTIDSRDLEKLRHVITHAVCAPNGERTTRVTHITPDLGDRLLVSATYQLPRSLNQRRRVGRRLDSTP